MNPGAPIELLSIAIADIAPSPSNPRKDFPKEDLAELAADIAQHGVLQPVLLRPTPEGKKDAGRTEYELVFGERRFRAAKLAGLKEIPATVRGLLDSEVLELQLVENLQRKDLHELELAAGYQQLHSKHGLSLEQLAERLGKSISSIRNLLKLNELTPKARELFRDGKLNASTALLVARIPDGKLQDQFAKQVADGNYGEGPLSYREAQELSQRSFMLELRKAPFDTKSATLCPAAGACSACPKRTGAQPELFRDVPADVCTDPGCYQEKSNAAWELKVSESKKPGGQRVLTAAESKKVFTHPGYVAHDSGYLKADSTCSHDPKYRRYDQLLGKHKKTHLILARDAKGVVHELLAVKEVKEALVDAGHDFRKSRDAASSSSSSAELKAEREAEDRKLARAKAVGAKGMAAMVAIVEAKEPDRKFWALLASSFGQHAEKLLERRLKLEAITDGELRDETEKRFLASIPKMDEGQLRGFVYEAVMSDVFFTWQGEPSKEFEAACEHFKIDLAELREEVKLEQKAAAAAEKEKPAKPAPGVEKVKRAVKAVVAKKAKAEAR